MYRIIIVFILVAIQLLCASWNNCYSGLHIPDMTLNSKITLWNHTDISQTHLKNIVGDSNFVFEKSMIYEDSIQDLNASRFFGGELYPYVLLYNRDQTEFAIASPYYGTCHQCWRSFYIGLLSKKAIGNEKHRVIQTDIPHFQTESGICLLLSLDEVITTKGAPNMIQDSIVTYYYMSPEISIDSEEYNYYKEHNIGDMFMTIILSEGKVIGIAYGYEEN
jgi:hypothetical protein